MAAKNARSTRASAPRVRAHSGRLSPLRSSDAFRAFVLDQLEPLGGLASKPMFGGVGLYCGDSFFGIIARDLLYLRTGEENRADYERAGMSPFKPYQNRPGTMQYYPVPIEVLESAPELLRWARKAVAAARAATEGPRRR